MRTIEEIKDEIMSYPNYESVPKDLRKEYQKASLIQTQEEESNIYNRYEITKDVTLDRLKEICKAEKEGRLVELPVNVGGDIYFYDGETDIKIEKAKITKIIFNADNNIDLCFYKRGGGKGNLGIWGSINTNSIDLDKTVFLTKEEAEKALKGGAE